MFKFWLKKKAVNPEVLLKPISEAFYSKKYKDCISKAEKLFINGHEEVRWNAKRFAGLAYYKQRKYRDAVIIFKEIANHSNNTDDWFNLMTSSIRNKQIALGEEAYERFNHPNVVKGQNGMLTYANVTFQMMLAFQDIEEYTKALEKLITLKKYICQVKQHDSEFLSKHGVPFIFQTLVASEKTLRKMYSEEQIQQFLNNFALHVDNYGKESIKEFRERFKQ